MKTKYILFLFFLVFPILLKAVETKVHLLSGGEDKFRAKAEAALTSILNEVNKSNENKTPLGDINSCFDKDALIDFKYLVNSTKLYALQKEYRTYLILTKSGDYEVRNIKVRIFMGGTKGIPFQNLVFIFNKDCKIINVHFSLEDHHYQEIIEQGKKLNDLAYREKILHFIELYRTAYNKKDYEFIKKTLSDDALIIVGRVIKTKKQESDFLETSYLSDEKIEFIKLSKNEYLKRLKNVFKRNDFVKVLFDRTNIKRHPKFDKIYGVQLKQRWHSSFYSDEGYLFLLVDFINEQEPIIHVRAWQPDKFTDGSTISIFDFEIIE